jgi:hypothetical protein
MDPASLVLVPVGVALWKLGEKIQGLRETVSHQEQVISSQQQAISALQNQQQGKQGSTLGSAAVKAALWSGVIGAGLVAVNMTRVLYTRNRQNGTLSVPPASYRPKLCTADDGTECVFCHDHCRDALVQPCNHLALCWPCATRMQEGERPCPICRGPMESLVYVYHA